MFANEESIWRSLLSMADVRFMVKNMTTRYDSSLCSSIKEWSDVRHATAYLDIADEVPHRAEGEAVLLEHIPINAKRV
jgi:hypothetical protein